jgi:hypothetical protein
VDVRAAWRFVGGKMPALATLVDLAGEGRLNEEERATIGAALSSLRDPTVKGTPFDNLIALSVTLRYEVRAVPSAAGGRPVKLCARSALRKVVRIGRQSTRPTATSWWGMLERAKARAAFSRSCAWRKATRWWPYAATWSTPIRGCPIARTGRSTCARASSARTTRATC